MGIFSTLITQPLGYIIKVIYELFGNNYGVSIIMFTILVRVLLLPLSIKQHKAMAKTQKIAPLTAELQRKYKNDKEKLNQEMVKIYQKNNINPLGGCLPLLIQFPILIGIIQVIYRPITYILKQDATALAAKLPGIVTQKSSLVEIAVAKSLNLINFNFMGIDLSAMPKDDPFNIIIWIIPLLATAATYLSGKFTQAAAGNSNMPQNDQAQQMNKSMTTVMPIMTLFFTYTLPVAAALYWFISSAIQTLQQVLLNKFVKVDDIEA